VEQIDVMPIANVACERRDALFRLVQMIVPGARDHWYAERTDVWILEGERLINVT